VRENEAGWAGREGVGGSGSRARGRRGLGLLAWGRLFYKKGSRRGGPRGKCAAGPMKLCREPNNWLSAKNFSKTF
jgi:hypothetical protein